MFDPDDADDVVESLEDAIAALSDLEEFGREFEDRMVATNSAGTPNRVGDRLDPNLHAGGFFNGLMSGIRFESTAGTRFRTHVVRREDAADAAFDAARGDGPDAYPRASRMTLPPRATSPAGARPRSAEAMRRWLRSLPGNGKRTTPCAGKIRLVAGVTRMSVKDTITELKDESGRTWRTMSREGRDKAAD